MYFQQIAMLSIEYKNSLAMNFEIPEMKYPLQVCETYNTASTKRLNFCQRIIRGSFLQIFCYLFDFLGGLFKLWGQLYHILETLEKMMEHRKMMMSSTPTPKFWNRLLQRGPFSVITKARKKTRLLYYALRLEHRVLVKVFDDFMKENPSQMYDEFDSEQQSEMQDLRDSMEKTGDDLNDCFSQVKMFSDVAETTTLYVDVEVRPEYS